MSNAYRIIEDSLQEKFFGLRSKVQFYGGGFANGKTSAACIKALELARDYPGSNGLMARSTYPKLNDTLRKEFLKWCPKHWIKSFPMSSNGSNTCTLTNGTTINFRYIQQQGGAQGEASTSNLLSATYDWVIVDQMEDPEITEKDFDDLLGRLRGMARYTGDDPTMPASGPRWFIITANPSRNWLFKKLVRPVQVYKETGRITPDLLCERDSETEEPILDEDGKPIMLIELVEGSTYENKDNLTPDFIKTLESTYRGAMKDRFLMGDWGSYEGLIYPTFDDTTHVISHSDAIDYLYGMGEQGYTYEWLEGYDFGIAVPSCYIAGQVDAWGNVFLLDGFYEKEADVEDQLVWIKQVRAQWGIPKDEAIFADPAVFRRTSASKRTVGRSTADMFWDKGRGVRMSRGNNDILNGILKVSAYLAPKKMHRHPIYGTYGAPHLYVSDALEWVVDEFNTYMWAANSKGDREDRPRDKDDHAMDTIKYMLSRRPEVAKLPKNVAPVKPSYMQWRETEAPAQRMNGHRYG